MSTVSITDFCVKHNACAEGASWAMESCVEPLDFDWSCLAQWHNWIALDADGEWLARGNKPECWRACWYDYDYSYRTLIPPSFAPKNFTGEWKDSLRERPKV